MAGIGRIGFGVGSLFGLERLIAHVHFARLAVQLKKYGARAVGMGISHGEKLDDQRFPRLDIDGDLLPDFQAWLAKYKLTSS